MRRSSQGSSRLWEALNPYAPTVGVHMCNCLYIYTYMYTYIYMHILCVSLYIYVCLHYMCTYIYIYMYVHMCMCMCLVCIYKYICIYQLTAKGLFSGAVPLWSPPFCIINISGGRCDLGMRGTSRQNGIHHSVSCCQDSSSETAPHDMGMVLEWLWHGSVCYCSDCNTRPIVVHHYGNSNLDRLPHGSGRILN